MDGVGLEGLNASAGRDLTVVHRARLSPVYSAVVHEIVVDSRHEFFLSRRSVRNRGLIAGAVGVIVGAGVGAVATLITGGGLTALLLLAALAPLVLLTAMAVVWYLARQTPAAQLTAQGLRAPDVLNRLHFLRWEDVEHVEPRRWWGLFPYLVIHSAHGSAPLWLALDVARPEQLRHALEQLAPSGHVLRQALTPLALPPGAVYRDRGGHTDADGAGR